MIIKRWNQILNQSVEWVTQQMRLTWTQTYMNWNIIKLIVFIIVIIIYY